VYGSDAIAGVINIITRKNFTGGELSSQAGKYLSGDGFTQSHSVSLGDVFDSPLGNTSWFGDLNYADQRAISTQDRELSKLPKFGTGLTRGSSFLPDGRFLFIPNEQNGLILGANRCPNLTGDVAGGTLEGTAGITIPQSVLDAAATVPGGVQLCDMTHVIGGNHTSPTDYRAFVPPGDNYNYAADNILTTPLKTYGGFFAANHDFGNSISLSAELMYEKRASRQQLAAQPICVGNLCPIVGGTPPGSPISYNQATYISRNNPYNPFMQDIGRADPAEPTNTGCDANGLGPNCALGLFGQGAVLRRPVEAGPRIQEQDVPTMFGHLAAGGNFDLLSSFIPMLQPLNWEIGYGYGQSRQTNQLLNSLRVDRIQRALGDNCTGDCVPLDFFGGAGSITQAMLDYIRYSAIDWTKQTQKDLYANVSTGIDNLLPAGTLGIAFGVEKRDDHYRFQPDQTEIDGTTAGLTSAVTEGSVSAKEAFLELEIPILHEMPFIEDLKLSLAGRFSKYETFGSTKNGKVGLEYRPYADLLLRSTYSNSFRAPDVGNLFLGEAASFPGLADPCVSGTDSPRTDGSNTDINCNADGIPGGDSGVKQPFAQIISPFGGNKDLEPETSHSFSAGFVFNPEAVQGLDIAMDYYDIILRNFISVPGAQGVLDLCYQSDPNFRQYCGEIVRDPNSKQLLLVHNRFQNFPRVETSGIDMSLTYKLPTTSIASLADAGIFRFVADATFLASYDTSSVGFDGTLQTSGSTGQNVGDTGYPRWKINPSLQWERGPWSASWQARIVWHQSESCFDGLDPSLSDLGLCSDPDKVDSDNSPDPRNELKTTVRHDLQLGYNVEQWKTDLTVGMQNVFDTDPPVSYSAFANSMDASDYWVPGRFGYVRLKIGF
jgi:iron complex outermembrane receptor protein